jgi:hypothetical protein
MFYLSIADEKQFVEEVRDFDQRIRDLNGTEEE